MHKGVAGLMQYEHVGVQEGAMHGFSVGMSVQRQMYKDMPCGLSM